MANSVIFKLTHFILCLMGFLHRVKPAACLLMLRGLLSFPTACKPRAH
jgi:hypothetical protein